MCVACGEHVVKAITACRERLRAFYKETRAAAACVDDDYETRVMDARAEEMLRKYRKYVYRLLAPPTPDEAEALEYYRTVEVEARVERYTENMRSAVALAGKLYVQ